MLHTTKAMQLFTVSMVFLCNSASGRAIREQTETVQWQSLQGLPKSITRIKVKHLEMDEEHVGNLKLNSMIYFEKEEIHNDETGQKRETGGSSRYYVHDHDDYDEGCGYKTDPDNDSTILFCGRAITGIANPLQPVQEYWYEVDLAECTYVYSEKVPMMYGWHGAKFLLNASDMIKEKMLKEPRTSLAFATKDAKLVFHTPDKIPSYSRFENVLKEHNKRMTFLDTSLLRKQHNMCGNIEDEKERIRLLNEFSNHTNKPEFSFLKSSEPEADSPKAKTVAHRLEESESKDESGDRYMPRRHAVSFCRPRGQAISVSSKGC